MYFFNEEIIKQISTLNSNSISEYIDTMVKKLESAASEARSSISVSPLGKTALAHGFIPRKTAIISTSRIANDGFILDDNKIYEILIKNIQGNNDIRYPGDILQIIQQSIDEYFGGLSFPQDEQNRQKLLEKLFNESDYICPHSIAEYRNNHTALCTERSAIAQNLIAFLGGDSYCVMGHLSDNDGFTNMNHAYTIIKDKEFESGMLIDFTNPIIRSSTNEKYVYKSGIKRKDELDRFLSGNSAISISRPEFCMRNGTEFIKTIQSYYSYNELSKVAISKLANIPVNIEKTYTEINPTKLGKESITTQNDTLYMQSTEQAICEQESSKKNHHKDEDSQNL